MPPTRTLILPCIIAVLCLALCGTAEAQNKKKKDRDRDRDQPRSADVSAEQQRQQQAQQLRQQMEQELAAADRELSRDLNELWDRTRGDKSPDRYEQQRNAIIRRRDQAGVAIHQKYDPQIASLGGTLSSSGAVPAAGGDRSRRMAEIDEQIEAERRRHKRRMDDIRDLRASTVNRPANDDVKNAAVLEHQEKERHEREMRELQERRRQAQ